MIKHKGHEGKRVTKTKRDIKIDITCESGRRHETSRIAINLARLGCSTRVAQTCRCSALVAEQEHKHTHEGPAGRTAKYNHCLIEAAEQTSKPTDAR